MRLTPLHRKYINQALSSGRLSYGPFLKSFEAEFAKLHNRRFGISTNSGQSALQVAVRALKDLGRWRDDDEVLVPATTFPSTPNAVILNNLKPVFADIDPRTYHIDPRKIQKYITSRTRAIMPVHLFGLSADMEAIMAAARRHKLKVIEDSAQSVGVRHRGEPVGSQGDIACYSTYVSHIVSTGVGGMVLTNDPRQATLIQSLVQYGRDTIYRTADDDRGLSGRALKDMVRRRFNFVTIGYSYRLTELEGALGMAELTYLQKNILRRQKNAEYLRRGLAPFSKYLQLPWWPAHSEHAFMMFPVAVITKKFSRDELTYWLEEQNIETRPFYSLLSLPVYSRLFGNIERRYPVARWARQKGFFIGCHPELQRSDLDYILAAFREFFLRLGVRLIKKG